MGASHRIDAIRLRKRPFDHRSIASDEIEMVSLAAVVFTAST
jgi:hypothetical protein